MLSHLLLGAAGLALAACKNTSTIPPSHAAYFLENNPEGAHIWALPIQRNGTVGAPVKTATGGIGSLEQNYMDHSDLPSDTLGAQGSVTVFGDMLFTVNAGSNTVSMFSINPDDPLNPTLVGCPVDTLGEFPISVAYSSKLGKACVLNGGAVSGITCFTVNPYTGLVNDGPIRTISKSVINETTPPTGPPGSAAQVLFNPDSTAVFATFKGTGGNSTTQGSIAVWPVSNGSVSNGSPVYSKVPGLATPFGYSFITENTLLISDASNGGSLVSVASNWSISGIGSAVIPTQNATCWTWYLPELNAAYLLDSSATEFYVVNPQTGDHITTLSFRLPDNGNGIYDSAALNGKLYSLVGTNGILVYDLVRGAAHSYYDLTAYGDRQYYEGFAIWSS